MLIKEGGDKEMEVDITKQQDDDSIRTYCDQVMEDKNGHDSKRQQTKSLCLFKEFLFLKNRLTTCCQQVLNLYN
jgi:hypothetical protein